MEGRRVDEHDLSGGCPGARANLFAKLMQRSNICDEAHNASN